MDQEPGQPLPDLEFILSRLEESLTSLRNHKGTLDVTPEIKEELSILGEVIEQLEKMDMAALEKMGTTPEKYIFDKINDPNVPNKTKQLLKIAKSVETDSRRVKLAYARAAKQEKDKAKKEKSQLQGSKRTRRKLFKPLGGDKNWLPL